VFANVVVDVNAPGLPQAFTYRVPDHLENEVFEGACVAVPFSGRELIGYVLELLQDAPDINNIKDLAFVIRDASALNPPLLKLARWMSEYYAAPLSHSIRAIVPEVMSATVRSRVRLVDANKTASTSPNQQHLVRLLAEMQGEADMNVLAAKSGIPRFSAVLQTLKKRGAIEIIHTLSRPKARPLTVQAVQIVEGVEHPDLDKLAIHAPKQAAVMKELLRSSKPIPQSELLRRLGASPRSIQALVDRGFIKKVHVQVRRGTSKTAYCQQSTPLALTIDQENALRTVLTEKKGQPTTVLLHGVTGSGKTEVYLQCIDEVLRRGRTCLVLVPEIALTVHLIHAYTSRFENQLAVLHSRLSVGERYDEWRRIENGEAPVVLGARSAVFAPVRNLGLVVIDEEHEPSYKQDHCPRYHARTVAEKRAEIDGACVILGSATPAVESYYRAVTGQISLATLQKRIDDRPMPLVNVVDLREEFERGRRSLFSQALQEAIVDRLSRGEQVILFVNRRGYASFILCRTCGYVAQCKNCAVSLTYHSYSNVLRCHHCDFQIKAPAVCPKCGGPHIRQFGVGTERVEAETKKVFPNARVIRMDSDTTSRKGSHAKILHAFREREADILVGTQMVAKGLDFPNVTLVGVISADTSLHMPDFRAAERTFQLLTQVGGRAGRGNIPGEVIVQTFSPEHYAVRTAAAHDYQCFYEQEIGYRSELCYPPFSRLINIISADPVDSYARNRLAEVESILKSGIIEDVVDVLGPAPAPISRLKGYYRYHMLIRDRGQPGICNIIRDSLNRLPGGSAGLTIDVDPLSML